MNLVTLKNCFKIWASILPEVPNSQELESWTLLELSNSLHTSYISYLLKFDTGSDQDRRFEKAYLRLSNLVREYAELETNTNKNLDKSLDKIEKLIEDLEKSNKPKAPEYHPNTNYYDMIGGVVPLTSRYY